MLLGFKNRFKIPIEKKIKIHSFREDKKNRWKAGNTIQAFIGVRQKWMEKIFNGDCISVQKILLVFDDKQTNRLHVTVDRRKLNAKEVYCLAINDGFENVQDLTDWFFPVNQNAVRKVTMFSGKIIHWTDFKY